MDFIAEWIIKGFGFGIGMIGCSFALVAFTGLVSAVIGIIGAIADAVSRNDNE